MVYIYILQLQDNKYYIGKTTNPEFRIEEHFGSGGSAWTRKYKPLKVVELIPDCDDFDEDKYTKIYMSKFGINNVRGGSFCQIVLDDSTVNMLQKMICSATDKCYLCEETGHFIDNCPYEKKEFDVSVDCVVYNQKYPSRCQVDCLDYDLLQKLTKNELLTKGKLNIDERILSHIYEHKDIGCHRGKEWHLRQYTNAYLTNYGNILICCSHIGKYPEIDDRGVKKELVANYKLSDIVIKILLCKKWNCNHQCKLKEKLVKSLKKYENLRF